LYPALVLRSLTAERLLAVCALAVGVMGIVSAATPEMANRYRLMHGVLPPGWPDGARVLTMACAIGLIFLARSLARRRHRAWQLAILVVLASAAAHLVKGLDFEEATISLLFLFALIHWRDRFDVPGDPASVRLGLGLGAAVAAIVAVARANGRGR
jgi:lysyl-tRNA synthetase class 2